MNFENQIMKQAAEQPAYIASEQLLKLQRAAMVRYERAVNAVSLMPPFFALADELEAAADAIAEGVGPVQRAYVQTRTDAELSAALAGLCRTVRALPAVCKRAPAVTATTRTTLLPARTAYDVTYHCCPGAEIDAGALAAQIAAAYSDAYSVVEHSGGFYVVDPEAGGEIEVQRACAYAAADAGAAEEMRPVEEVETPNCSTIEDLAHFVNQPLTQLVKAVMYEVDGRLVFVNIRGDLKVSDEKLRSALGIGGSDVELKLAPAELLEKHGLVPGFSGLIGVRNAGECAAIIVDESVRNVVNGTTGANKKDFHFMNFNLARDTKKIAKFIRFADVASEFEVVKGAVVAEVCDLKSCYPEMIGLNSKYTKTPLYKITVRLVDLVASLVGRGRKINGAFVINVGKDDTKLKSALEVLRKCRSDNQILVDNRPKANFGQKMQIAELSLFKYIIIVSPKHEQDTVVVNDELTKIEELEKLF